MPYTERTKCPFTDYRKYINDWMKTWRLNPRDYDIDEKSPLLNGYSVLTESYGLSEESFSWVGEFILDPFIESRIKNKVNTNKQKFGGDFTFDFEAPDGNIYHGVGWWGSFDGYHYYLKDEDFNKIEFPKIPDDIPGYVKIIDQLRKFDDFKYEDSDELKEMVESWKIGDIIHLKDGKTITVLDINNGNITISN